MPETTFPGVEVHHRGGHYAVLDAGAQVLAWTPPGQNPVLWLSPLAVFEPGVAVRGGIPVVFPWFGAGLTGDRRPAHGFARTADWRRSSVVNELAASGHLEVRHSLDAGGFDSAPFAAELTASFSPERLEVTLSVTNTGSDTFTYEEALHTYLAVNNIAAASVSGLDGCRYLDRSAGAGPDDVAQAGDIRFEGEVDRVFSHTGDAVVSDPAWGRSIHVGKTGSANTVVWNPGPAKGQALGDVGPNWTRFVCVEAGNVRDAALHLAPGEQHILTQSVHLS